MYDGFVLNAYAKPRKSLAIPINAFFASSAANIGVSAAPINWPRLSKAAIKIIKFHLTTIVIIGWYFSDFIGYTCEGQHKCMKSLFIFAQIYH